MKGFHIKLIIMEWSNYDNVKLDKQSLLGQIRNNWHIELPSQFIELIVNFNNGVPKKNVFDTEVSQRMLGSFLNFNKDANYNAFEVWESIKKRLPELVFPIASDPFGNFTCFDYRNNIKQPEVIFWEHEGYINEEGEECYDIEYAAKSFSDFINKLYTPEGDDENFTLDDFEVIE